MNNEELDHIYKLSKDKLDETSLEIKRYSYDSINWGDRLIGIRGQGASGRRRFFSRRFSTAERSGNSLSTFLLTTCG